MFHLPPAPLCLVTPLVVSLVLFHHHCLFLPCLFILYISLPLLSPNTVSFYLHPYDFLSVSLPPFLLFSISPQLSSPCKTIPCARYVNIPHNFHSPSLHSLPHFSYTPLSAPHGSWLIAHGSLSTPLNAFLCERGQHLTQKQF